MEVKIQNWKVEEILQVAKHQRNLILLILVNLIVVLITILQISSKTVVPDFMFMFLGAFRIAVFVASIYLIYLLAKATRSSVFLYVILVFFPIIGLIALLQLSGIATKILRDNGIKVGLMGANKSDLENLKNFGDNIRNTG